MGVQTRVTECVTGAALCHTLPNPYVEVLTPRTSGYDCPLETGSFKSPLLKGDSVKMKSLE